MEQASSLARSLGLLARRGSTTSCSRPLRSTLFKGQFVDGKGLGPFCVSRTPGFQTAEDALAF
jgi:hypothetical protein